MLLMYWKLYCTRLYCTILYYTVLCHAIYSTLLSCTGLYYIIIYHTISYYIILYHTVVYSVCCTTLMCHRSWKVRCGVGHMFGELCSSLGGEMTNGTMWTGFKRLLQDSNPKARTRPHLSSTCLDKFDLALKQSFDPMPLEDSGATNLSYIKVSTRSTVALYSRGSALVREVVVLHGSLSFPSRNASLHFE